MSVYDSKTIARQMDNTKKLHPTPSYAGRLSLSYLSIYLSYRSIEISIYLSSVDRSISLSIALSLIPLSMGKCCVCTHYRLRPDVTFLPMETGVWTSIHSGVMTNTTLCIHTFHYLKNLWSTHWGSILITYDVQLLYLCLLMCCRHRSHRQLVHTKLWDMS